MPKSQPAEDLMNRLRARLGASVDEFLIPPPVFAAMGGEFIAFNQEEGWLQTRFPVRPEYLNPYRTMQGGMIAAAVDNTLGPLGMLVAAPNVTRRLEMKFSRPVQADQGHFLVLARFLGREGRELRFSAEVRSEEGSLLVRARATHWIMTEE
jgi:acyl-coenzyme A thioesterase PaaI-like protein